MINNNVVAALCVFVLFQTQITIEAKAQKRSTYKDVPARYGLSESRRKTLFKEIIASEDKADAEAGRRFPNNYDANLKYYRKLKAKYRRELGQKYSTTAAIVDSVWVEGTMKHWDFAGKDDSFSKPTNSRISLNGNRKVEVYSIAQSLVKKSLKSPSSASFPWSPDEYEVFDLGSSRYSVTSWVDSENSFGAMIRTRYQIVMNEYAGRWTMESMKTN